MVSTATAVTAVHAAVVQRATFKSLPEESRVADEREAVGADGDRRRGSDAADGVDGGWVNTALQAAVTQRATFTRLLAPST
jgi:hypothetical protein